MHTRSRIYVFFIAQLKGIYDRHPIHCGCVIYSIEPVYRFLISSSICKKTLNFSYCSSKSKKQREKRCGHFLYQNTAMLKFKYFFNPTTKQYQFSNCNELFKNSSSLKNAILSCLISQKQKDSVIYLFFSRFHYSKWKRSMHEATITKLDASPPALHRAHIHTCKHLCYNLVFAFLTFFSHVSFDSLPTIIDLHLLWPCMAATYSLL